jgi:DNA polymerase-3 subunit beta
MKLSIARSELLDSLSIVSRGMSSRSTLPILSGVLITVADGAMSLQSTDLEISLKNQAPALVEQEGQTVVPGRLLTDIVRALPEAAVTLELDGEVVIVKCLNSSFTVRTMSPEDFPKFPEVSPDRTVSLPSGVLSAMVKKVSKAVSRDETRAVLTGILLVLENERLRLVATDSYRLAVAEVEMENAPEEGLEVVIPGRALDEAVRLAAPSDNVVLGVSENQIVFEFGETIFVTRRIEGSFPNYKQLIPKEKETTVTLPTEELMASVKRVALLAMHNTPLKVSVAVTDQTLSLSATTQDVGDASEDLMVKAEGKDVDIAFNHAFLVDGLASVSTENVRLEVQNAMKPGLLKAVGDDDFLYLLMPVRLT